ncbi:MAG TPA: hypothetical protein HPP79_13810 [Gammaproteobacteria bacterium]|nr:hypothetical protein [Gammaproteobacteria bacterium]
MHGAYAEWVNDSAGQDAGDSNKFSPLGVSILGSATGVNGNLALGNVRSDAQDEEVWGVRADFNVAGNAIQVVAGELDAAGIDDGFTDIIVTRDLSGAKLSLSAGQWNSNSSMGAKLAVKF